MHYYIPFVSKSSIILGEKFSIFSFYLNQSFLTKEDGFTALKRKKASVRIERLIMQAMWIMAQIETPMELENI